MGVLLVLAQLTVHSTHKFDFLPVCLVEIVSERLPNASAARRVPQSQFEVKGSDFGKHQPNRQHGRWVTGPPADKPAGPATAAGLCRHWMWV